MLYNSLVSRLVFLKLGGSLITDKTRPYTARLDKLSGLASEIAAALMQEPALRLVLGHGSGSFGHTAARQYRTRDGIASPDLSDQDGDSNRSRYWCGFAEVWYQASELNRFVMDALHTAGVPALALAPVASVTARTGQVAAWDLVPLTRALDAGLVPVVYGDVIFDEVRGGTILSTEDLFLHLARHLHPDRILLAGLEAGVWADFPARTRLFKEIGPDVLEMNREGLGDAAGADVTGGMRAKVEQMLSLAQEENGLEVRIFSGEADGAVKNSLAGEPLGTVIHFISAGK